jgi:hypothetical protein
LAALQGNEELPKLAVFLTCDKVLLDDDQNPSAIGIFSAIMVGDPSGAAIPENALSPKEWSVLTQWRADTGDSSKEFVQKSTIANPKGEFGKSEEPFSLKGLSHTIKLKVPGMPVGVPGNITIKVWLESAGKRVTEDFTQTVTVSHMPPKKM